MSNVHLSYKALLDQLARMSETNTYLRIQNTNLLAKNKQLQKEKQDLEKRLALIKKPTISKNVYIHEPIDDIIASIF